MTIALTAPQTQQAQQAFQQGGAPALWEYLASQGDNYADNASAVITKPSGFLGQMVTQSWISLGGDLSKFPAMLRDTTGRLQNLVQQFVTETDLAARRALTTQIIYAWVGVENIAPDSRGYIADARQLHVLEAFLGEGYIQGYGYNAGTPNAGWNAGEYLTGLYNELADSLYSQLMAQTHLKPLLDSINITWDAATGQFGWDVSNTVTLLQSLYNADLANSISEFANALRLNGDEFHIAHAANDEVFAVRRVG